MADVFNPAAIVKDNKIHVLFRAEDNPDAILGRRTSRIGLATSEDGIHFDIYPEPVLYPDSGDFLQYDYPGGCEDPRVVVTEEGLYVMAYTAWNQDVARLSIAFSRDLIHWEKKGPAFATAYEGKFLDLWSKSGSIITRMEGKRRWSKKSMASTGCTGAKNSSTWHGRRTSMTGILPWMKQENLKPLLRHVRVISIAGSPNADPPAIHDEGIVLLYNGKNQMRTMQARICPQEPIR